MTAFLYQRSSMDTACSSCNSSRQNRSTLGAILSFSDIDVLTLALGTQMRFISRGPCFGAKQLRRSTTKRVAPRFRLHVDYQVAGGKPLSFPIIELLRWAKLPG